MLNGCLNKVLLLERYVMDSFLRFQGCLRANIHSSSCESFFYSQSKLLYLVIIAINNIHLYIQNYMPYS